MTAGPYVLVSGWPGAGKSTLARGLATDLALPLLAKDAIKEVLMEALGAPATIAESRRLGRAAVLIMLQVAHDCPGAVMDSTWFDYALPLVGRLPGRTVQVRCLLPLDTARRRYRARSATRHAGHLDAARGEEELWGSPPQPLGIGPVIDVDTSAAVDVTAVAAAVRAAG